MSAVYVSLDIGSPPHGLVGELPFIPEVPLVAAAALAWVKPLAAEVLQECLRVLPVCEAIDLIPFVFPCDAVTARAEGEVGAERVDHIALLSRTEGVQARNLKRPVTVNAGGS
jgi:hypothetical protein